MFAVLLIVNLRDEQADVVAHRPRDPAIRLAELAAVTDTAWLATEARELADQRPRTARTIRTHIHRLRCLGARLGHHLFEQQRALDRGASATLARANALSLVRAMALSDPPAPACRALAARLATERKKFLMSNTADALLALDERLRDDACSRRELHGIAMQARDAISTNLLVELGRRTTAHVERTIGEVARGLLAEVTSSLEELGERVSLHAFAGFDMVVLGRPHQPYCSRGSSGPFGDLVRFSSRSRIIGRARDELLDTLAVSSRHVIDSALEDCEAACDALARRMGERLDAAVKSVLIAMEAAESAHRAGHDHVARRRQRLADWSRDLETILASF
jgi:hypothetical protein